MLQATPLALALAVACIVGWLELGEREVGSASPPVRATASSIATSSSSATSNTTPAAATAGIPGIIGGAITPNPSAGPSAGAVQPAAIQAIPPFSHIYLIVMENHEYGSIVGSSHAPYLNSLIRRYGLATNYHAVTHPSEPNYLALFAGSTFGIRNDGVHNLAAPNLADQIGSHGRSWHVYAQDLPSRCYTGSSAHGGVDLVGASGWYARKHEPAISFTDISRSGRCALITHLTGFSATAANFELIVPNMTNDMHDGTVAQGDAFLRAFVPRITSNAAFASSLLLITWDEGSTGSGGGGHVATLVISPRVPAGFRSAVSHTHYSLLKTIENAWGLGCLGHTCTANDLREFFAQ
jgi:phosphatidylinositol-3-phosphatase